MRTFANHIQLFEVLKSKILPYQGSEQFGNRQALVRLTLSIYSRHFPEDLSF